MKPAKTPKTAPVTSTKQLALSDPKRKLTREEWKTMPKELKAERKAARQAARGPVKARFVKLMLRYATGFEKQAKKFELEEAIKDELLNLSKVARNVGSDIDELPDTWHPAGRTPRVSFQKGQHVQLIEARRPHYSMLGADVGDMEVIQTDGRHVMVKTKGGVRVVVDAKHIQAKA